MARTNKKVGYSPSGKLEDVTPDMAASGIEAAFRRIPGVGEQKLKDFGEAFLSAIRSHSTENQPAISSKGADFTFPNREDSLK